MGGETTLDGGTELQIAAGKVLRGKEELPLSSGNGPFDIGFCGSVEVHDSASILQLWNQNQGDGCRKSVLSSDGVRKAFNGRMQLLTGSTRSF